MGPYRGNYTTREYLQDLGGPFNYKEILIYLHLVYNRHVDRSILSAANTITSLELTENCKELMRNRSPFYINIVANALLLGSS